MNILITGGAGFIGSALAKALIDRGDRAILIDNFNDYYDPQLKRDRVGMYLKGYDARLYEGDIRDRDFLERVFSEEKPDKVVHLAAMAGVRYSIEKPALYADVNVMGTVNMLDMAVKHGVKNFVYASSSSVYGDRMDTPYRETDRVDSPISPYAATKKATELLAFTYSHLHKLPTTGLRFFTVYGPWGRPDMACFSFTRDILEGKPIKVYNYGNMTRNFTFIDDIVSGTMTTLDADLACDVMNIGGDSEETLLHFIETIEKHLGMEAKKELMERQPGDVLQTVADIQKLRALGWAPTTRIDEGIKRFVDWYREYYRMS